VGPDRNKNLRNVAIIIVIALAVWKLPGGGTAAATIANLLTIAFVAATFFFGFRFYMEHRETIFGLEERQRGLLYGALALAAFALVATKRMWDSGGLGGLLWLAMLGAAAWAIYSVWRAYRTY
jgi:hypothetical protein